MKSSTIARLAGLAVMLGGLLWIPLRYFATVSWDNTILGLGYRGWNSLVPIPLLLLLLGVLTLRARYREGIGRLGRAGLVLTAVGLAGTAIGVIVEFWWAGGLAGNRLGANIGWAVYLASYILVLTLGLWLFGIALIRTARLRIWSLVPLLMGALTLSWPLAIALGGAWESEWAEPVFGLGWQVLFGLGWLPVGYVLYSDRAQTSSQPRPTRRTDAAL